ncbi:hypothetical protein DCAR_0728298 [Daucus carota subsp. sativus]|uniref:Uncharacterized protein n=1 Tax=Daucus carota subsp. sativus TaxID=79200 RepID=A0A175YGP4_DAUCS|nr:hypothetical protein DCAR_0728298 [Daucus carota subsp. sativus]
MDDMLIQFNRTRLDIVEMVFFPICAFEHFYLIFYNIKNAAYEIIDNIDREIDAQIVTVINQGFWYASIM